MHKELHRVRMQLEKICAGEGTAQMILKELTISNFKMFEHLKLVFDPGFNLILGDNGVGKIQDGAKREWMERKFSRYLSSW